MTARTLGVALVVCSLFAPAGARAQTTVKLPDASPAAHVSQSVGMAEFAVSYARPAVKERKVWGGLVPWGEVWRAGANENTTLTATTAFTVEGKSAPAGKYGVHLVPSEQGAWTLILSKVNTRWGSYGYDAKDDLLRVPVTPAAAAHQERLAWEFEEVSGDGALLTLRWEKLRLPVHLGIDVNETTFDSLQAQLAGVPQFNPKGWSDAAAWLADHDTHLAEASQWADRSLGMAQNFPAALAKARIAEKQGDAAAAKALLEKGLAAATENEVNLYGYRLLGSAKVQEAIGIFQRNVKAHPESWNAYDSLAEAQLQAGDKPRAKENYGRALKLVKDEGQRKRLEKTLATL
jgi:tetratricopeptide (TPR) repeat protein